MALNLANSRALSHSPHYQNKPRKAQNRAGLRPVWRMFSALGDWVAEEVVSCELLSTWITRFSAD